MIHDKPAGREAVKDALINATIEFIVAEGMNPSVREVAANAGVNHGLVHAYFGSKDGLLQAAADEINRRAAADIRPSGFPPLDLASRRGGELAKALARMRLDPGTVAFSSHPVTEAWKAALARTRPELSADEVNAMVASASVLAMGWAIFEEYIVELLELDDDAGSRLGRHIQDLVAELGGIPAEGPGAGDQD